MRRNSGRSRRRLARLAFALIKEMRALQARFQRERWVVGRRAVICRLRMTGVSCVARRGDLCTLALPERSLVARKFSHRLSFKFRWIANVARARASPTEPRVAGYSGGRDTTTS